MTTTKPIAKHTQTIYDKWHIQKFLLDFGTPPSRNPTLTATAGMLIRGYGLSNLSGARNRKECEVWLKQYWLWICGRYVSNVVCCLRFRKRTVLLFALLDQRTDKNNTIRSMKNHGDRIGAHSGNCRMKNVVHGQMV